MSLKRTALFHIPQGDDRPPILIRMILILTCTLVSFFHGSNDGQKGVGLLMLILIAFLPAKFALDRDIPQNKMTEMMQTSQQVLQHLPLHLILKIMQVSIQHYYLLGKWNQPLV